MAEWEKFLMYIGIITISTIAGTLAVFVFEAIVTGVRKLKQIYADRRRVREKPVVHGRWNKCAKINRGNVYKCSVCDSDEFEGIRFKYCPNCGAKMDEEVNDT